jgi:hypothetical protein
MSALPKQVRAAAEEANRIAGEIKKAQDAANGVPPPDPAAAAQPAAGAAPATDQSQGQPSTPQPAAAVTPLPVEAWEQKYRVLQGKYNAEVPRLQTQLRDAQTKLEQLQQQVIATQGIVASFSQRQAAAPAGQGSTHVPQSSLVKDDEIRDFGPELYDFIQRTAKQAVLPEVENQLNPMRQQVQRVANTASQVAQRATLTDQERVIATLAKEVPNWEQLNENEDFLNWLDLTDPYSGEIRGDLLKRAYQRNDAPRVVAFFKGFLNENAVVTPPPTPAPPQGGPQRTLDEFVAPGTPKPAAGAPNEAGKRTWTEAEIKQFYDDAAAGKFRRNPQRYAEIEADIFAAQRENRIVVANRNR